VNDGNYWQDENARGQIISEGPKLVKASGERVEFMDTCTWRQPGEIPIMRDLRHIAVSAPSADLRIIEFDITLEPLTNIRIDKTNHSLFAARMTPELSVDSGGTLVNAEGKTGEKDTFGVPSPWCDYYGTRNGVTEGLAIVQNPANRWYPSPWFTRDYGFFSPTPMFWLPEDHLDLPMGQGVHLRYLVIVHTGDTAAAGIAKLFDDYKEAMAAIAPQVSTAAPEKK
jgi:hypothetical protein